MRHSRCPCFTVCLQAITIVFFLPFMLCDAKGIPTLDVFAIWKGVDMYRQNSEQKAFEASGFFPSAIKWEEPWHAWNGFYALAKKRFILRVTRDQAMKMGVKQLNRVRGMEDALVVCPFDRTKKPGDRSYLEYYQDQLNIALLAAKGWIGDNRRALYAMALDLREVTTVDDLWGVCPEIPYLEPEEDLEDGPIKIRIKDPE